MVLNSIVLIFCTCALSKTPGYYIFFLLSMKFLEKNCYVDNFLDQVSNLPVPRVAKQNVSKDFTTFGLVTGTALVKYPIDASQNNQNKQKGCAIRA